MTFFVRCRERIKYVMKRVLKTKIPRIGMRMIKSAVAVFLCFLFYLVFRKNGIIFYSQLAALWCIQPQMESSRSKAWQRTVGTMTGAVFGLIVLLIDKNLLPGNQWGNFYYDILVALAIIGVIYVTLLIRKKDASYFSCVVFLSIVVIHIGDANPYLFVFDRVMDTLIGIAIGMFVNSVQLPHRKEKNILFISGMDDTLLTANQQLSPYSLVEINRMLADGARFTVSTKRTPASLLEPLRGVHLKLPVIAMDGAVMYDITKHEYMHVYVISQEMAQSLREFLEIFEVNYFMNMLLDNMLVIQYKELINEAEKDIYEKMHISPYRNYTNKEFLPDGRCIYFMLIDTKQKIQMIYDALQETEYAKQLRIITYDSDDYQGYAYIKIYNKNATREHMIAYLKQETGASQIVTFGSIAGKYDVVIHEYDNNKVAKTLKKMYEPLLWTPHFK